MSGDEQLIEQAFPGDYTDITKCGEGTFGVVYRVKGQRGDQYKAVKIYPTDTDAEGLAVDVVREIASLVFLDDHENIITINRFSVAHDTPAIIMPAMTHSLYEYLQNSATRQCDDEALRNMGICKSICHGIAYMHAHGFMHRDLKPGNVLINNDASEVKISDFGSTRRYIEGQLMTMNVTTLFYRAPEILFGSSAYALSVDVWSLACTCAEVMMGGTGLFRFLPSTGTSDGHAQVMAIFNLIGTNDMEWAMHPDYTHFNPNVMPRSLANLLPAHMKLNCLQSCPLDFIDVIISGLDANPSRRICAQRLNDTMRSLLHKPGDDAPPLKTRGGDAIDPKPPAAYLPKSDDYSSKRTCVIDWLVQVHHEHGFNGATLHLAVDVFDRYSDKIPVPASEMQLTAIVALMLASKLNETSELDLRCMIAHCNQYTTSDFVDMEKRILSGLDGGIMILSEAAFELSQISDVVLRNVVQYLFESAMLRGPRAYLRMKRAKRIRNRAGIRNINEMFKLSTYASMRKKFGNEMD
tara:strand:+ start:518 stop:2086 length:1569 start_codon:yes stop_codon:yes gene_type:complete